MQITSIQANALYSKAMQSAAKTREKLLGVTRQDLLQPQVPANYFVKFRGQVSDPSLSKADAQFVQKVGKTFAQLYKTEVREMYLFETARLRKTFSSEEILKQFPLLTSEETFKRLAKLYKAHPTHEEIKRLFVETLRAYIENKTASEADAIQNAVKALEIDITHVGLQDETGKPLTKVLYEDTAKVFPYVADKAKRDACAEALNKAYTAEISTRFIALLEKKNKLLSDLGYADLIGFYSKAKGYDLPRLGQEAIHLLVQTEGPYRSKIEAFYTETIKRPFSEASRPDAGYLFNGVSGDLKAVNVKFSRDKLLPLVRETFDHLGLNYSGMVREIDPGSLKAYKALLKTLEPTRPIQLDVVDRPGKRSRAYHGAARYGQESYVSVKPMEGLNTFSTLFHEMGHAFHRATTDKALPFPIAILGNKAVTEAYAYLFQNLFENKHWLMHQAHLTSLEADKVIQERMLKDVQTLRRYASKVLFELELFNGTPLTGKPAQYAALLTKGTGFQYEPEAWTRDVDNDFYVADYFTAWILEAQLRDYLQKYYGGDQWYANPAAGRFLKTLWKDGNMTPADFSNRLINPSTGKSCYTGPTDIKPLVQLIQNTLG